MFGFRGKGNTRWVRLSCVWFPWEREHKMGEAIVCLVSVGKGIQDG